MFYNYFSKNLCQLFISHDLIESLTLAQFAPSEWLDRLGGGPQADAITDRIVHDSVFFNSGELNMREMLGTSYSYSKGPA